MNISIGSKIYKPVETQEQCDAYAEVASWCNEHGATIEDKGEYYEVAETPPAPEPSEYELRLRRIKELKRNLTETDYVVIKIAEGAATQEEYAEIIAHRAEWREEINRLEEENKEEENAND